VGMLVGFYVAGLITNAYVTGDKMHDWETIWIYPAVFAFGVMLLFALFFKNEKIDKKDIEI
ncbi:MFS transporter, partial [Christiangramia aquimixticola]